MVPDRVHKTHTQLGKQIINPNGYTICIPNWVHNLEIQYRNTIINETLDLESIKSSLGMDFEKEWIFN